MNAHDLHPRRAETLLDLADTLAVAGLESGYRVLGFESDEQMRELTKRAEQLLATPVPILAVALALIPVTRPIVDPLATVTAEDRETYDEHVRDFADSLPSAADYDDATEAIGTDGPSGTSPESWARADGFIREARKATGVDDAGIIRFALKAWHLHEIPVDVFKRVRFLLDEDYSPSPHQAPDAGLDDTSDPDATALAADDDQRPNFPEVPGHGIADAVGDGWLCECGFVGGSNQLLEHLEQVAYLAEQRPTSPEIVAVPPTSPITLTADVQPGTIVELVDRIEESLDRNAIAIRGTDPERPAGPGDGLHGLFESLGIEHGKITIGDEVVYERPARQPVAVADFATAFELHVEALDDEGRILVDVPELVGIPPFGVTTVEIVAEYINPDGDELEQRLDDRPSRGLDGDRMPAWTGQFWIQRPEWFTGTPRVRALLLTPGREVASVSGPSTDVPPYAPTVTAEEPTVPAEATMPPKTPAGSLSLKPLDTHEHGAGRLSATFAATEPLESAVHHLRIEARSDNGTELGVHVFAGLDEHIAAAPAIRVPPHAFRDPDADVVTVTVLALTVDVYGNRSAPVTARINIARKA